MTELSRRDFLAGAAAAAVAPALPALAKPAGAYLQPEVVGAMRDSLARSTFVRLDGVPMWHAYRLVDHPVEQVLSFWIDDKEISA